MTGSTRSQDYRPGWTARGGIEGAIGGGWTAKLEYLYLSIYSGVFALNLVAPSGTTFLGGSFNSRITDSIVRVGLNYNFSGP